MKDKIPYYSDVEVFILCGGKGTRLQSVISDIPKPMAPVAGKPFLHHLVDQCMQNGFINFCFLTGHMEEKIRQYFSAELAASESPVSLRFSHETVPLGTAGAIKKAIQSSRYSNFLVINGDSYLNTDLRFYYEQYRKNHDQQFILLLKELENFDRYGSVQLDSEGNIIKFEEKMPQKIGLINAGIYIFNDRFNSYIADTDFSLEQQTFPRLLPLKLLRGLTAKGFFVDIGIPEDYALACKMFEEKRKTSSER